MRVRFVKSWQTWKPGDVISPPDGVANVLLQRNLVEKVDEEPIENKAVRKPARKKYGR